MPARSTRRRSSVTLRARDGREEAAVTSTAIRASEGETSAPLLVSTDPLFDAHHSRGYHPERPERLVAARRAVEHCRGQGVRFVDVAPRDATDVELAAAHAPEYLDALASLSGRHAALDADTYVAPASVDAARRAAGCAVALVDAMLEPGPAAPRRGVALLRPPGHHATRAHGMGFCLLNNAAVAACAALDRGLDRVAIVDWDVHHGNGTQDIFWEDPRVLYVSLHQFPFYPGTGDVSETGSGEGRGATVNVPLSAGATDAVYAAAFERVVLPVLDAFAPELVLVSAGFDAHERDPLAAMRLTEEAFGVMAGGLAAVAGRHAAGRIGVLLEGGYDLTAIEASLAATLHALAGAPLARPADARPRPEAAGLGGSRALDPTHEAEIARAHAAARGRWGGI
jgi:acetoin utilization deacetylase AcuC-like enzyme